MAVVPTDPDLATALITTCARFTRTVRYRTAEARSTAGWRALAIIDEHGPLRVSDFAVLDQLTQPSATAMLRRLGEEGILTRVPDPSDGRATLVDLSDLGREQLAQHRAAGAAAIEPLLAGLSPDQRAALGTAMGTLSDLLDSSTERPPQ